MCAAKKLVAGRLHIDLPIIVLEINCKRYVSNWLVVKTRSWKLRKIQARCKVGSGEKFIAGVLEKACASKFCAYVLDSELK